jgi:hypothetical protein
MSCRLILNIPLTHSILNQQAGLLVSHEVPSNILGTDGRKFWHAGSNRLYVVQNSQLCSDEKWVIEEPHIPLVLSFFHLRSVCLSIPGLQSMSWPLNHDPRSSSLRTDGDRVPRHPSLLAENRQLCIRQSFHDQDLDSRVSSVRSGWDIPTQAR